MTTSTTDSTTHPHPVDSSRHHDPGRLRTSLRVLAVGFSLLLVAWGALTLASLLARGSGDAKGSWEGINRVEVDTGFESVEVVGSAGATSVAMDRTYRWSLGEPTVRASRVGDVLRVSSSCPFTPGLGCTGRVRLVVPAGLAVRADSHDGRLTLRGLTGRVEASSSGDVDAVDLTGELTLRTRDGSIDARDLRSATVSAQSADGDTRLSYVVPPRSVTATSADGSVTVLVPRDGTAYAVSATARDGSRDVAVPTDPEAARRVTVSSRDGSVLVGHAN